MLSRCAIHFTATTVSARNRPATFTWIKSRYFRFGSWSGL